MTKSSLSGRYARAGQNNVIEAFFEVYGANKQAREAEARRFATKLGVKVDAG